jgi:hypothetical protein
MTLPDTSYGTQKPVKKYEVVIKYTLQAESGYDVLAESEESAMNIARYRLAQDRKDYPEMRDITTEIRKAR